MKLDLSRILFTYPKRKRPFSAMRILIITIIITLILIYLIS